MSCNITQGFTIGCRDNMGGIAEVWLSNWSGSSVYTVGPTDVITGATTTPTYFQFEQPREGSSFNEEIATSIENGTTVYTQTLELLFHKNDSALRNQILLMAQARLSAVVKDQNGKWWLLGKVNGIDISAGSRGFGKAYGDLNGAKLTFIGKEAAPAQEIESGSAALTAMGIS